MATKYQTLRWLNLGLAATGLLVILIVDSPWWIFAYAVTALVILMVSILVSNPGRKTVRNVLLVVAVVVILALIVLLKVKFF